MNKDFLVTFAIVAAVVAVYAIILVVVLPIDVAAISTVVMPGK